MPGNGIDTRGFRRALGQFATGVTVVTAGSIGEDRAGVTINSFSSVSLEPPLVLWCLRVGAGSYAVFSSAAYFCVNVLAIEQQWLSNRFAGRAVADRFEGVGIRGDRPQAPVLEGVSAHFMCARKSIYQEGDHHIFVGEVVGFEHSERQALIFHGGKYASSIPVAYGSKPLPEDNGFIAEFDFA